MKKPTGIDERYMVHMGRYLPKCIWCKHMLDPLPDRRKCEIYGTAPDEVWRDNGPCKFFEPKGPKKGG